MHRMDMTKDGQPFHLLQRGLHFDVFEGPHSQAGRATGETYYLPEGWTGDGADQLATWLADHGYLVIWSAEK